MELGLAIAAAAALVSAPAAGRAQSYQDLQRPHSTLSLEAAGSFYVSGRSVPVTAAETGMYGGGTATVDQMYVQFMVPQGHRRPPIVMIHGATLSGKSYETTPDGRVGWYEYFTRQGFPSYVVDQVDRARSGFDQSSFNKVSAGLADGATQPKLRRIADDIAWVRFRFGPAAGQKFADAQFPVEAAGEFAKQIVPDLTQSLPPNDPNYVALAALAKDLKGAVLMGHSQAGRYPFETALLDARDVVALVALEPVGCNSKAYSQDQIVRLARLPILIVFGDHLDAPQQFGAHWDEAFDDCRAFVDRINGTHGNAKILHPPDLGIHGNSHMIMQDKNNLQIADLIIRWIDENVGAKRGSR